MNLGTITNSSAARLLCVTAFFAVGEPKEAIELSVGYAFATRAMKAMSRRNDATPATAASVQGL